MDAKEFFPTWPDEQKTYLVNSIIRRMVDEGERHGLMLEPYFAYFADILGGKVKDLFKDETLISLMSASVRVAELDEVAVQTVVNTAVTRMAERSRLNPEERIYLLLEMAGKVALSMTKPPTSEFVDLFSQQLLYSELILHPVAQA